MQLPEIADPPPGVRHRAVAAGAAGRRRQLHPPVGARVPEDRRAHRHGQRALRRRLGRGDRVPGHQAAGGFHRRHRRGGRHHLDQPRRAEPDPGALPAREGRRRRRGRGARPHLARAQPAAAGDRRAGDRQGGGRRLPGDLAGLHQRHPHAAADQRPGQPHRQAAPADRDRRGRRAHLRRAQATPCASGSTPTGWPATG